jgi:hypothetical protein
MAKILRTSLSPAEAGSQIRERLENPRLKAGAYGPYAGFAGGPVRDVRVNRQRIPVRFHALRTDGSVAAVRTVAPGFKPGVPKRDPNFVSALQCAIERFARIPAS